MTYKVKEIFYTLQGEGANAGRAAVFLRFSGCNLWSGKAEDRATAFCKFCDTDFVGTNGPGGGTFEAADALADAVLEAWPSAAPRERRMIVCTGGEPFRQLDAPLIEALHARGFFVAVETNGTLPAPPGLDWICVSPKPGPKMKQREGNELKLVFPQTDLPPETFDQLAFGNFFLQPMDGPRREENTRLAVEYCKAHPRWRLSLQTHKYIGIP